MIETIGGAYLDSGDQASSNLAARELSDNGESLFDICCSSTGFRVTERRKRSGAPEFDGLWWIVVSEFGAATLDEARRLIYATRLKS